jgi:phage terminase small subunit
MADVEAPKKALNPRQEAFCQEYLKDLNATQAAIRAGYSEHSARQIGAELLSKPEIQARIQAAMEERAKRTAIDVDYVLSTIKETVERCKQAEPVLNRLGQPVLIEGADGDLVPAYVFRPAEVLKGAELLGKHLKMFTERHEHSGPNGKPIEVKAASDHSDEELKARVDALLAKRKGVE